MSGEMYTSPVRYFAQFGYAPRVDEWYIFLPKRMERSTALQNARKLAKIGIIIEIDCGDGEKRYTQGGYSTRDLKRLKDRIGESRRKREGLRPFLSAAARFPIVQLIGLSGSVAMNNADAGDDIDLFVIAREGRMYTARFLLNALAFVIGRKRAKNASKSHVADTICLNMFFDEKGLEIPEKKQNRYVAHEVLQMKPLVNKNNMYERFLKANSWAFGLFPNAKEYMKVGKGAAVPAAPQSNPVIDTAGDIIESILKRLQLWKINMGKTTETVTATQLWFFPDDFEKKVRV